MDRFNVDTAWLRLAKDVIKQGDSIGEHYFNEIMNSILDDYYKIQAYK